MGAPASTPLVTVCMPACNAEAYLREAIDSVLAQTHEQLELVVVDDASEDRTAHILREYAKSDRRVRVLTNEKRGGRYQTRNRALFESSPNARYVAVMDADDVCEPLRLQKQVAYLEEHPDIAVVGSHISLIDESSKLIGARRYPTDPHEIAFRRFVANPFAHPTVMMRAAVLRQMGGYDGSRNVIGDYELFLRMLDKHRGANLDEYLVKYRVSPGQSKATSTGRVLRQTVLLKLAHLRFPQAAHPLVLGRLAAEAALCTLPPQWVLWLYRRVYRIADVAKNSSVGFRE